MLINIYVYTKLFIYIHNQNPIYCFFITDVSSFFIFLWIYKKYSQNKHNFCDPYGAEI